MAWRTGDPPTTSGEIRIHLHTTTDTDRLWARVILNSLNTILDEVGQVYLIEHTGIREQNDGTPHQT